MSRYFSRLAGKTGLFPQSYSGSHSGNLQKNASATPVTRPVEFHSSTDTNDITERHDTVSTSSISVTETPILSEKKLNMGDSTIEDTAFSSTKNTHQPISQIPGKQTEPLPTVETGPHLQHSSITVENSGLSDQKSQPDIQLDKNSLSENRQNTVNKPLVHSESLLNSSSNKHNKPPANENTDRNSAFSMTTNTPLEKKDAQNTTESLAHDTAHKKNMSDISRAEHINEKNSPENTAVPEPARQSTNSFENENTTHRSSPAQSQAKTNRQQRVHINIGQISIDIQQNPDKPSPEKVLSPRQIQHSEKPQNRSSAHSLARNETRLSRYYLSGW